MATSFSAAALAADGIGTDARMLVGSGYAPDRGAYALDLVRGSEPLREALGPADGERRRERDGDGHQVQMRWRDLDGLGHVNHTVVAHLPRGGPRRVPRATAGSAATSTSSGAARSASAARSTRRSTP